MPVPLSAAGSIAQRMPLRSTNKIPINAPRLPTAERPPLDNGTVGGSNGSSFVRLVRAVRARRKTHNHQNLLRCLFKAANQWLQTARAPYFSRSR